jgi:uncharacterized protein YjlB
MSVPHVTHWNAANPPTEYLLVEILRQQGLNPVSWSNGPYDTYSPRKHNYLRVIYVVRGSITFIMPVLSLRLELKAGDRLELPAGVVHRVEIGADGAACVEGHLE